MAPRLLSALVLAVCLVSSIFSPGTAAEAQVPGSEPVDPGTVILTCPEDGLSIDLNHASAAELMEGLSISRPVANRVITSRPHYAAEDLLMVNGIGLGKLRRILEAGNTCSTPEAFHPPTPENTCMGDEGETDLQLASRDELKAELGLSNPVVARLLERRQQHPFPSVPHALIIAGIGPGELKRYDNACLTPPNIETVNPDGNSVGYAWISPHLGGETSIEASEGVGNYGLRVPAGVMENGAWAEVIDLPQNFDTDGPRADFHIYGEWTGDVSVTLPADPFDETATSEDWIPTVFHETNGSRQVFWGDSLSNANGNVTVRTSSLSIYESLDQLGFTFILLPIGPESPVGQSDLLYDAYRQGIIDKYNNQAASCSGPAIDSDHPRFSVSTSPDGLFDENSGVDARPPLRWCAEGSFADPSLTVRIRSARNLVYETRVNKDMDITGLTYNSDPLTDAYFGFINQGNSSVAQIMPPGATATYRLDQLDPDAPGTGSSEADFTYDPTLTSVQFLLERIGNFVPNDEIGAIASCLQGEPLESVDAPLILQCLEITGSSAFQQANRVLEIYKAVPDAADVFEATLSELFNIGTVEGTARFKFFPPPPQPPVIPPGGGGGGSSSFIAKVDGATGRAVFVTDGVVQGDFASGGDYICAAQRFPVVWLESDIGLTQFDAWENNTSVTCNDNFGTVRDLDPAATRGVILREDDGTSWFFDDEGTLFQILNGGCFLQLAASNIVWDFVSDEELAPFVPVGVYIGDACLNL